MRRAAAAATGCQVFGSAQESDTTTGFVIGAGFGVVD